MRRAAGLVAALGLLTTVAAAAVVGNRAAAYPGAPWFEPSKPYDDNFPDPSIVLHDGTYYAYGTSTGGAYLPVMTSTDLQTWVARPAYDQPDCVGGKDDPFFNDALPCPRTGVDRPVSGRLKKEIWAPGAARIGTRFVVFYSVRDRLSPDHFCVAVATSSSPLGPFLDVSSSCLPDPIGDPKGSIDPQPFVAPGGVPYLIWKTEGVPGRLPPRIWSQRLASSGTSFAPGTAPVELLHNDPGGWEGDVVENPSMVVHGGRTWLFFSANEHLSARYATGYAECSSPLGPCTKFGRNPVLASRGVRLGPGAPAAFVDKGGSLRVAYHWWNAPYTNYPSDPGCDGTDRKTGAPLCESQGQRRLGVEPVFYTPGGLQIGGSVARDPSSACQPGRVPEDGFADVPASNPHEPAIDCVRWWDIVNGTAPARFSPAGLVSRGQMASFIVAALEQAGADLPEPSGNRFPDDDDSVHERNIERAADAGIVGGYPDGSFRPAAAVTRAQMATFLVRAAEYARGRDLPAGRNVFYDDEGNPHEPAINASGVSGFTAGIVYRPNAGMRRDQMASFLARLLDLFVDERLATPPA